MKYCLEEQVGEKANAIYMPLSASFLLSVAGMVRAMSYRAGRAGRYFRSGLTRGWSCSGADGLEPLEGPVSGTLLSSWSHKCQIEAAILGGQ
jgi:hypothetical protein